MRTPPIELMQPLGGEVSCSLNGRSENIVVKAIIIPELELRNVEMQISFADIVECPHDASLEDRPETLNRIGVNRTDDVLPPSMIDGGVRVIPAETMVANPLIGTEQANLMRNGLVNECRERRSADVLNDASDDVALAADSTSDDSFARTSWPRYSVAPIPMAVLSLAADECF